ncbi:MAG: ABC transporter ATP-binding protein [Clostridiales bacterium]|nr:ABC transporter ATP-binding protein [Clostridiales bacterium]
MNAITISGLTKTYPGFQLGPLDLTLPAGSILGLVGENGAGKSTTLKLLMDLVRPDAGTVTVLGQSVPAAYPQLKEEIGWVLDEPAFPSYLNAREIGRLMSAAYAHWDEAGWESQVDRLGLPWDRNYGDFSRGMKMQLGLAAALSHNARLLVLDEATSGLDPAVRQEILDMLYDFCDEGRAVIFSSHIVSDLEKICDYVALLHRGRLVLLEEKDRLLERVGLVHCEPEQLDALDPSAVLARETRQFTAQALVERDKVPAGWTVEPVGLEELLVLLMKEGSR